MDRDQAELMLTNVRCATSAEAKVDLFCEFFFKVVLNDIHTLEDTAKLLDERLDKLERAINRAIIILGVMIFAVQVFIGPALVKFVEHLLGGK